MMNSNHKVKVSVVAIGFQNSSCALQICRSQWMRSTLTKWQLLMWLWNKGVWRGGCVLPVSLGHAHLSHFPTFLFMLMKCRFTGEPYLNRFTTCSDNLILIQCSTFVILPPNGCSRPTITFLYLEYLKNLISQGLFFMRIRTSPKSIVHVL